MRECVGWEMIKDVVCYNKEIKDVGLGMVIDVVCYNKGWYYFLKGN